MKHFCAKLPFPIDLPDIQAAECDFCGKTVAELTAAPATPPTTPLEQELNALADGAAECCFCGGAHAAADCPVTYTPIKDCEHKNAADGCCSHPQNMTPECHVGACPRLHRRIYDAWNASLQP